MFAPGDLDADRRRQGFGIQSPQLNRSMNSGPGHPQLSLFFSIDLLTIPSPTTTSPFPHDRFDTLRHRRELPRLSPGQTSPVRGPTVARSRVCTALAGSPTGLAESSSRNVTDWSFTSSCSPPPSREDAVTFSIRAGNVHPEGTFTLLVNRLHRRTRSFLPERTFATRRSESGMWCGETKSGVVISGDMHLESNLCGGRSRRGREVLSGRKDLTQHRP